MIGFLLKGLLRDHTRSLFPALTVIAGVTLTVFLQTYLQGLNSNMSDASAAFSTGHLKVSSRAAASEGEQASNELALSGVAALVGELRRQFPDVIWTPRIRFGGLLDIPDQNGQTKAQAPVFGFGINLLAPDSPDRKIMRLDRSVVRGRLPAAPGEILVSDSLAKELGIEPGATATLISTTLFGGMSVTNFKVAGTVDFGVRAMDRGAMIADLADMQSALEMDDAAGEILGLFRDSLYRRGAAETIATSFNAHHPAGADEFSPVMMTMHGQPGVAELLDYIEIVARAATVIFTVVMSIVLWNAGLVGSLRRYGEIGLRLAFGEGKGHLYRSMLVESLAIGLFGSIVGTALALAPSYWMQVHGLDMGYLFANSSLMLNNVIRTQITAASFAIGFVPGVLANLIGTAIAGIGIYKRQTATLMKELEA
ncbi:MAG TPA: FtsX-like permease family protein [Vicinamibacterales bacterium]|jgi:putative ABC transport system permease protein